ncbi:MAG: hypothetical protein OXG95_00295 [Chloroflexi bacterium]|nr:hypothetical protein [Chloroflexota bacterium]
MTREQLDDEYGVVLDWGADMDDLDSAAQFRAAELDLAETRARLGASVLDGATSCDAARVALLEAAWWLGLEARLRGQELVNPDHYDWQVDVVAGQAWEAISAALAWDFACEADWG